METLVAALAGALPAAGRLFDGPWLVVPGRPVELFVDLDLARRRGISGNLDTMSLEGAFSRLCTAARPDVILVNRLQVVGALLELLVARPAADDDALRVVDAYLSGGGRDADAVDRRRVSMAQAAAALFSDWRLTRPERMAGWRAARFDPLIDDRDDSTVDDPRLLRALHSLWSTLFGPGGTFERRGRTEGVRYLTLETFLDDHLDEAWQPPPAVHLFGFTELPAGWQRPIDRLAAKTAVTIYAINPCREFWEDLDAVRRPSPNDRPANGPGSKASARRRTSVRQLELGLVGSTPSTATPPGGSGAAAGGDRENPFLALWGRASRDSIRRLDALCDSNADARFEAGTGAPTLLSRVQEDILVREPLRSGARRLSLPADGSLVVLRAPEPRRECEAIAAEIWRLVREDDAATSGAAGAGPPRPPLRFCDVAVLVAGPDEPYLSLAPSVFHEANLLPHTLVDVPLASVSRVPEAILGLLALPGGALTRREVLDVLTHPNIKARFPDADATVWLSLCDALGIARGADRAAFSDTYVERDVFNWDQGLRRLVLGRFASGPRSGADRPIAMPGPRGPEGYLPAELAPDFRDEADALGLLARSLLGDVRFAREARLTLAEWIRFVHALLDAYVLPLDADDEAARLRVFAALDQLAAAHRDDTAVRLTVASALIHEALGTLRGTRGQVFGNGVVVGSLAALRALPFRVIFLVGLSPERFPAAERVAPLDPGGGAPTGDASPAQRDRASFLHTLLAARERLYLSFVDRDPLSGDRRDASAVLLELTETLRDGFAEPSTWTRQVPARRDEDALARAAFPIAAAEATARALGRDILAAIPGAARLREPALEKRLAPSVRARLAPWLRTLPDSVRGDRSAGQVPARRTLRLSELRRFLECPLQGGALVALGLRNVGDDTAAREAVDEPFGAPRSLDWTVLGDLFLSAWRGPEAPTLAALQDIYDQSTGTQRLARLYPAGPFGAATRRRHLRLLEIWRAGALDAPWPILGPAREIVFGRPDPGPAPVELLPALHLPIEVGDQTVDVEVRGRSAPLLRICDEPGSLVLGPSAKGDDDRDALRLFLDHLAFAASASPTSTGVVHRALILKPNWGKTDAAATSTAISFSALGPARARAYLTELVTDLLTATHDYLFPCEAIFLARKRQDKDGAAAANIRDCIIETRDDPYYRQQATSGRGPVPRAFDYPPPSADEAEALAARRFGLFFELRQAVRRSSKGRS